MLYRLAALLAALGAVLANCPGAAQDRKPDMLQRLLSAPLATSLSASADGKLAWVVNNQGSRNIWIAEPPEYEARQLTSYQGDDGQEITALAWTPAGRQLVFVRGNFAHQGEHLNPRSRPLGSEQALWTISSKGGAPRHLGDGDLPAVSPVGQRVAFLRKGQIWWASLEGEPRPEALIRSRGSCRQLRWSPNGASLAFLSDRGTHSFIGVYTPPAPGADTGGIRWLDPSVDRASNPAWSPDGRQLAFVRIPATREVFTYGPVRTAEPWSIRIADVGSGEGRQVWQAKPGVGSAFRGIEAANQISWAAGDRLVFPWEGDGWTHLYSVPSAGGEAKLLTPGKFEVEAVSLSPDRTRVLYNSNQDDRERRHLWSVPATGEAQPVPITRGRGIEWGAAAPLGDTGTAKVLAFLRADGRLPPHPVVQIGSAAPRPLTKVPDSFPAEQVVEPGAVSFSAADGMQVPALLFLPRDLKAGERRPAVVYFHGGSRRQMLLGWHPMPGYSIHHAINLYLVSRGFIVLSVNYRSGIGYGMEFREAPNHGAHGASEFNDVQGAALYLQNRPDVDPARIGLWGGSYGGYLTALGLARASDLFAAGVNLHGVYDWNVVIRNFEPTYDPLVERKTARLASASSPAAFVKTWRSPVLVIHGDHDPEVPFSESVRLVGDLRRQGVHVEQLVFPDEAHGFLTHEAWLRTGQATAAFFERFLKSKVK